MTLKKITYTFGLTAATVLLSGAVALAQAPGAPQQPSMPQSPTNPNMMVKDHEKDLKDFKDEAQVAQNPNVKQIATRGANIIEQHLQLAEQLAKTHNVPVEGKEMSSTK